MRGDIFVESMQAALLNLPFPWARELHSLLNEHSELPVFLSGCILQSVQHNPELAAVIFEVSMSPSMQLRIDDGGTTNPVGTEVFVDISQVTLPGSGRVRSMCASIAKGIVFMRNMISDTLRDRFMIFPVNEDEHIELCGILPGATATAEKNRNKLKQCLMKSKSITDKLSSWTIGPDVELSGRPLMLLFSFSKEIHDFAFSRTNAYLDKWCGRESAHLEQLSCVW